MSKKFKVILVGLLFTSFLTLMGYCLFLLGSGKGELVHYNNPTIVIWYLSVIVLFIVSHLTKCWE